MEANEPKKLTPPYLSRIKLSEIFSILSTRNLTKVTSDELQNYGFGRADASFALGSLKFLRLIDESGKVTDLVAKLKLKGDVQKNALGAIIKDAYIDLFNRIDEPYKLNADELYNEFLNTYGVSPRVARAATPAFLWLCEFAGLIENTKSKDVGNGPSPRKVVSHHRNPSKVKNEKTQTKITSDFDEMLELPFSEGIRLLIPKKKISGITFMSDAYRDAAEAISALADILKEDVDSVKETKFSEE